MPVAVDNDGKRARMAGIGQGLVAAALLLLPGTSVQATGHRGHCTVVPWTDAAAPTVQVRINGQGPYSFVVDSGAEFDGWIRPDLAEKLGMAVVGKVPPDGPDDPEQDLRFFAARSLQLGDMTFRAPRFAEMLPMGPKRQAFDGILGSALFARLQVAFDYRNRQLFVSEAPLHGGQQVRFDRGMPIVPLTIGTHATTAYLDTGNIAGALFVAEGFGRSLPLAGEPVAKGKVHTHYGEQTIMEAALAAPVRAGTVTLPVSAVRWPPAIGLQNLGSRALGGMLVRIDARSRRVAITPAGAPLRCGRQIMTRQ